MLALSLFVQTAFWLFEQILQLNNIELGKYTNS